jgi:hypothetical protein
MTFYDPNATFSGKVYAMPDTVMHVPEVGLGDDLSHIYDEQILTRIKQNLAQFGYTEVDDPDDADVTVVAMSTTADYSGSGCYYGYWDWWYGYPGYCYPVYYSFTTGTILIGMNRTGANAGTRAIWVAGINGLISESSSTSISSRINKNIDQAFDQSPYLK